MYQNVFNRYEHFKESRIFKRRFSESLWYELIQEWSQKDVFEVSELGKTFEERPIHQVRYGQGPIRICAWSQMHGDEATATKALADFCLKRQTVLMNCGKYCIKTSAFMLFPV